jgi:hypothetical protein
VIGNESNPLAPERPEIIAHQHVDPGQHLGILRVEDMAQRQQQDDKQR